MENTFFLLIILISVVAAVIMHHHLNRVPLPIVFIVVGILLALLPLYHHYIFNPNLFLFFIVAPLLYNEAQSASRYWIGRGAINIFSLSIMLVIATVIIVGSALHLLFPFLPLALAIALCAIVTPTDASAVSAFAQPNPNFQVPFTIMQNESLFNDASGFVAFDLSLLAFTTGSFSANRAVGVFALEFIGGLITGAIIGALFLSIRRELIQAGDDTPFVMITLELLVPFLAYFVAERLTLSGILAVVAAGLFQGMENDSLQLVSSRVQLVRSNIWEIVQEALTGVVFVLLGVSLPTIMEQIISKHPGLLGLLILIGIVLYVLKFVIRLLWSRFLVWMHISSNHRWQDAWLMAVSGASGTISLSLAFLLPTINGRDLTTDRNALIFVVTVVILISLTVAAIAVPIITKMPTGTQTKPMSQWTREMIMTAMNKVRSSKDAQAETHIVVDALSQQLHQNNRPHRREQRRLFEITDAAEREVINRKHDQGDFSDDETHYYLRFLDLTKFTFNNTVWQNLWLRVRFGVHSSRLSRDLKFGEEMFFTTPLIAEQFYWQRQFHAHGEDIRPLEEVGYQAVMHALRQERHQHGEITTVELHDVQRFYRERHRRMNMPDPVPQVVYQLFLTAFHAEYEFVQNALDKGTIDVETAESLQQHIIFDEMAYIQNNAAFIKQ
ncbi:cation:proton antiporter [Furfurilactobacillus milii]|uniref:Sodium:proton antiporter n=1 Tax=Furfurilactobacillus milii TaxID=2888272 RepID=A0ABT6DAJ7_9LACO|nr:sodium:proton antiporter [Furfurilactobacillus milii]QLE67010.1 Na -H antiporter [Furfurilactobacillus rossiae]MCF6161270.1 sodium:proton antiporter [Furfurilactobacillus milii]MCF6163650.1 sodium:proton antiporter [Furfurilactobacillus milii]MDF9914146.1 sodium:proton antiporter [Furfurilactobacillus milii]QLE69440.1 Na -H antiporter [Furfurilactobacillus rossiae]